MALLLLESGALIVAVTLVLWRMKAPGASGRAVTATMIASAVYLVVRFGLGAQAATSTYTETGLGFADVSAPQLGEIFANAPWLLWLYNVVASVLTVAASEPRAGKYLFVEAILHGRIPLWMYVHVVTSVVTTGVIVWALATSRISAARDRYIAAAGVTVVILGSALGFLYTRDRIALSAGIGYAMLVYVAVAAVLEGGSGAPTRSGRAGLIIATGVCGGHGCGLARQNRRSVLPAPRRRVGEPPGVDDALRGAGRVDAAADRRADAVANSRARADAG